MPLTGSLAKPETVAVLLSIFNGEKYLQEQLDSLLRQTHTEWTVIWRDDGSSDGSRGIVLRFAATVGEHRCIELANTRRHIGATRSYMALLRAAAEFPLVAFADQDDVWLPAKLARAAASLCGTADTFPALYCARQIVSDSELHPLGVSMRIRRTPSFPGSLVQNIASGCTVVLNRSAVALINTTSPPENSVHDWWCYIVVSAATGRIIVDDAPVILYRQHGSNAIGVAPSSLVRAIRALRRGPNQFVRRLEAHVAALRRHGYLLPPTARRELDAIALALDTGPIARAGLVWGARLRRQTRAQDLLLACWLCLGRGDLGVTMAWRHPERRREDLARPSR